MEKKHDCPQYDSSTPISVVLDEIGRSLSKDVTKYKTILAENWVDTVEHARRAGERSWNKWGLPTTLEDELRSRIQKITPQETTEQTEMSISSCSETALSSITSHTEADPISSSNKQTLSMSSLLDSSISPSTPHSIPPLSIPSRGESISGMTSPTLHKKISQKKSSNFKTEASGEKWQKTTPRVKVGLEDDDEVDNASSESDISYKNTSARQSTEVIESTLSKRKVPVLRNMIATIQNNTESSNNTSTENESGSHTRKSSVYNKISGPTLWVRVSQNDSGGSHPPSSPIRRWKLCKYIMSKDDSQLIYTPAKDEEDLPHLSIHLSKIRSVEDVHECEQFSDSNRFAWGISSLAIIFSCQTEVDRDWWIKFVTDKYTKVRKRDTSKGNISPPTLHKKSPPPPGYIPSPPPSNESKTHKRRKHRSGRLSPPPSPKKPEGKIKKDTKKSDDISSFGSSPREGPKYSPRNDSSHLSSTERSVTKLLVDEEEEPLRMRATSLTKGKKTLPSKRQDPLDPPKSPRREPSTHLATIAKSMMSSRKEESGGSLEQSKILENVGKSKKVEPPKKVVKGEAVFEERDGQLFLKAVSLERLKEMLLTYDAIDPKLDHARFLEDFFYSYRAIMPPLELFEFLETKFLQAPPTDFQLISKVVYLLEYWSNTLTTCLISERDIEIGYFADMLGTDGPVLVEKWQSLCSKIRLLPQFEERGRALASKGVIHEILIDAAFTGNLENVQIILQNFSKTIENFINQKNIRGQTALYCAARQGHTQVVQALLKVPSIDLNITESHKSTPLHGASYGGHADIVAMLLLHGANPNCKNENNFTPKDEANGDLVYNLWISWQTLGPEEFKKYQNPTREKVTLKDVSPRDLAQQLTLMLEKQLAVPFYWEVFNWVHWEKKNRPQPNLMCPNLEVLVNFSEQRLCGWVRAEILKPHSKSERIEVILKFIETVKILKEINNFHVFNYIGLSLTDHILQKGLSSTLQEAEIDLMWLRDIVDEWASNSRPARPKEGPFIPWIGWRNNSSY